MNRIKFSPVILSCVLLSAHFMRAGETGIVLLWLSVPLLLLLRRRWVPLVMTLMLLLGAFIWGETTLALIRMRLAMGAPWGRLALIMGTVTALTAASALVFRTEGVRRRYREGEGPLLPGAAAFGLSALLLTFLQLKLDPPVILLQRFIPGGGWLELFWLATYAGWLTDAMLDPARAKKLRPRFWMLFSVVFFLQLAVGLLGVDRLLMTGRLHLPIPAVILAGPLYRGSGLFMTILFFVTILMVGPAWCSHLCYIGAWDDAASRLACAPTPLPRWRRHLRIGILVGVVLTALGLRWAGAPPLTAVVLTLAFMAIGIGLMAFWSRKTGMMTHCLAYCPISFLSNFFGRISPFRVRIGEGCVDCMMCTSACRYDALSSSDIERRKPGFTCTLCGDCIGSCHQEAIGYRFPGIDPGQARTLFLILAVSLHAVFLGVAMI